MKKIKTKKIVSLLLATMISFAPAVLAENESYFIDSYDELVEFASEVNSGVDFTGINVELLSHITVNEGVADFNEESAEDADFAEWIPIGTEEHPFTGNFNGNGYSVSGIYINNTKESFKGLFGVISNSEIINLFVVDSYINASAHSGAIVGYAKDSSIINSCTNINSKIITKDRSGGIVGWTSKSDVYNCTNAGECYSNRCSGGIVGDVYSNGKIYNCHNIGLVEGKDLVGGMTGGSTSADIKNCLNSGTVSSGYLIAGGGGSRKITNCFALKNADKNANIGGEGYIFGDETSILDNPVKVGDSEFISVVDAMNAFAGISESELPFTEWVQGDSYPYLANEMKPFSKENKTSFGSEVSDWAMPEIEEAYEENLIPDVLIGEDLTQRVNRAEFAAIAVALYENLSETTVNPATINPFTDISDNECKDKILTAYNLDITAGTSATTFDPHTHITREQMAAMLARAYKKSEFEGWSLANDADFPLNFMGAQRFADDDEISEYAKESVYFMVKWDIIKGVGDNKFAPKNTSSLGDSYGYATREQAVIIALRSAKHL